MYYIFCSIFPVVPNLSVTVFPTSYVTIGIVPFNEFTLNCKVSARVGDQTVPLPISLVWTRQQNRRPETNVSYSHHINTSGSPGTGYQSTLITNESMITSVTYRCKASLDISRNIQGSSQSVVTVVSKYSFMDCVFLFIIFLCFCMGCNSMG